MIGKEAVPPGGAQPLFYSYKKMWEPILNTPEETAAIRERIDGIYRSVQKNYRAAGNMGLIGGDISLGIFLSYCDRFYHRDPQDNEVLGHILTGVFGAINSGNVTPTFSNGLAGVSWGIRHLVSEGFIEVDDYDEEVLLRYTREKTISFSRAGKFDFLHGSLGMVYSLLRHDVYTAADLGNFIELLAGAGTSQNGKICWSSTVHFGPQSSEVINLGLAHGIPATVSVLSRFYSEKLRSPLLEDLVVRSVNYILSSKNKPEKKCISLYPGYIDDAGQGENSRMGWCYGDLGIAFSLLQAGRSMGREDWIEESMRIADHAAQRRDMDTNMVYDASLCHGTAGQAHMFNRFYQATRRESCREAAVYWAGKTLQMAQHDDGFGGYKSFYYNEGYKNNIGVLDGSAGIGLSLISLVSAIEPRWDSAFLLS